MLKRGIIVTLAILVISLCGMYVGQRAFEAAVIEPAGGASISSRAKSSTDSINLSSKNTQVQGSIQDTLQAQPHPIGTVGGVPQVAQATEISHDPSLTPDRTGNLKPGESVNRADRVVIHTAYMNIVVESVPRTMDQILQMANAAGGWLVSSGTDQQESGHISIRIPANLLENTMSAIHGTATETLTTRITSEDVTDEYVDLTSRLANDVNTRRNLEKAMTEMTQPEHILEVQRVLHEIQKSIEQIKGRLLLIEETAAYSLLVVEMNRTPSLMLVDAGPDLATTTSDPVSLSATFQSPPGVDDFTATWNMGDGSPPVSHSGTIPLNEGNLRTTATISHRFGSHLNSPYIVNVEIRGEGKAGSTLGNDQIKVTVIEEPHINITLDDNQEVYVGDEVTLTGYFTRPRSIQAARFEWDPGDGTEPASGQLEQGKTRAVVKHTYRTPGISRASFTIYAETIAGEINRKGSKIMYVEEKPGYTAAGINLDNAVRNATTGLTWTLKAIALMALWITIFSPIWGPAVGLIWWWRRLHPTPTK